MDNETDENKDLLAAALTIGKVVNAPQHVPKLSIPPDISALIELVGISQRTVEALNRIEVLLQEIRDRLPT